jgi:hypothetical protein
MQCCTSGREAGEEGEGEMNDAGTQPCPIAKIQRRLRRDEALIEMVRAKRVFLASRQHPGIPAVSEAARRVVELGLKAKSKT